MNETEYFGGTHISERKHASRQNPGGFNHMRGMIPTLCRNHGYKREKGKPIFWRHWLGVGGVYVFINDDHIRLRVKDLGLDCTFKDQIAFRRMIELIDIFERILYRRWSA